MLYRPALHGNWNALILTRRALKDKFPTSTVPLTAVLPNRQVFLPDPVYTTSWTYDWVHWVSRPQANAVSSSVSDCIVIQLVAFLSAGLL
jgi:hypothetical protein